MNYLLWRSQSAAHTGIGSAVPVNVVWDKIVTAPDNSSLDIFDHGKKIGFVQWTASAGGSVQALNQSLAQDYAPDGLAPEPSSYELDLDGNCAIYDTNRVRVDMHLRLGTNESWQDFHVTAKMRPYLVDIHAIAATGKITVKVTDDENTVQRTFKISDLENPDAILSQFTGADGPAGQLLEKESAAQAKLGIHWNAHEDWLEFGHSRVQVYRVDTIFFGQHLTVFTSPVGEILRVDLPNHLMLQNEAFNHL